MKHFIHIQDFTKQELLEIIDLTRTIKAASKDGFTPQLLKNASLSMIFEEPSTRTRASFEVGMMELGGHAMYMKPGEIHLGERETLSDTAKVLSRMSNGIMARLLHHERMIELAETSGVPVINGLTDFNHPTQVVCDLMTMIEHKPDGKELEDFNVTFVGDATNVLSSLMFICTKMGMHFTHAAPRKYQPPATWREIARRNCEQSGAILTITEDVQSAVKDADFIYTDLWWWVGQEDEIPERRDAFMPTYQVNMDLVKQAPDHVKIMHCLPASRGVEATSEVLDSEHSIIFDQAENRLHTEKGLLVYFIYPTLKKPDSKTIDEHKNQINKKLNHIIE